jgi:mannose-6-phosphate isomerase-like protein (cupin superfamily)
MPYRVVDASEIEPFRGVFRKVRRELETDAFGINQVELPPGAEGREHDETASGHEEVYVVLAGSGHMVVDGEQVELVPGRFVLVAAKSTRLPVAGPDGLTFLAVGSAPGRAYVPNPGL